MIKRNSADQEQHDPLMRQHHEKPGEKIAMISSTKSWMCQQGRRKYRKNALLLAIIGVALFTVFYISQIQTPIGSGTGADVPALHNPPRERTTIIQILPSGKIVTVQKSIEKIVHPPVLKNLQRRLYATVKELGQFSSENMQFYFDFDSIDLPGFTNEIPNNQPRTCETISKYSCCFNDLPMIAIASMPCCECSLPLPIHDNQMQSELNKDLKYHDPYNWKDKINKAVWHGSPTGHLGHAKFFSREFNFTHPYVTDTPRERIVSMANPNTTSGSAHVEKQDEDKEGGENILIASFDRHEWSHLLQYKYVVSVSGNSYSGLLKQALLSNSCVLRQDSLAKEWYEQWLEEWIHYVPVKYDLSDLLQQIRWAQEHDMECQTIGEKGREFGLKHFAEGEVNKFVHSAIQSHSLT